MEEDEVNRVRLWLSEACAPDTRPEAEKFSGESTLYRDRLLILTRVQFELGLSTGLRVNELGSIRWGHIWDDVCQKARQTFRIERALMKGKYGARTVQISAAAAAAIASLRHMWHWVFPDAPDTEPEHHVFVATHRHPYRSRLAWSVADDAAYEKHRLPLPRATNKTLRLRLKQMLTWDLGLPVPDRISTHSLRKTFARRASQACEHDLVATAELTGHRSLDALKRYLKAEDPKVKGALVHLTGI